MLEFAFIIEKSEENEGEKGILCARRVIITRMSFSIRVSKETVLYRTQSYKFMMWKINREFMK